MLAEGITRVELDWKGFSVELPGPPPFVGFQRAAALLAQAADALPLFRKGHVTRPPSRLIAVLVAIPGALAILVAGLAIKNAQPPLETMAIVVGLACGLFVASLATLAGARVLRGRSSSLERIKNVAVISAVFFPAGGSWFACWANRAFDTSPAVNHSTRITSLAVRKNGRTSHAVVASWRQDVETESLTLSPALVAEATPGRGVVVTTHKGRFGWEWVESFRLAETTRATQTQ